MSTAADVERIVVAGQALARIAALATGDDTPSAQWRALSILESTGPNRIGEIARLSRVTQPGMTRMIGQLEAAALVTRTDDPTDSRASLIAVTDAGRAALAGWRTRLRGALGPLFEDLTDAERAAVTVTADLLAARVAAEAIR